jgi:hypothetical protein
MQTFLPQTYTCIDRAKAMQNWKIFVNSYQNDGMILAKLTKRLITIIIVSFVITKINKN